MDENTSIRLQELSARMGEAVINVLKNYSTLNEYQDLLALAAFFFKFKHAAIKLIRTQAQELNIDVDIEENIEGILYALELELSKDEADEELTLHFMQAKPSDEYGPN